MLAHQIGTHLLLYLFWHNAEQYGSIYIYIVGQIKRGQLTFLFITSERIFKIK